MTSRLPISQLFDLDGRPCGARAVLARNEGLLERSGAPRAYKFGSWQTTVDPLITGALAGFDLHQQFGLAGSPMDRVSIWIDRVEQTNGQPVPPTLRVELRVGVGGTTSTSQTTQDLVVPAWGAGGELAFQASGILSTQWEIWAATVTAGPATAVPIRVQWTVLVDQSGCCERDVVPGPWI